MTLDGEIPTSYFLIISIGLTILSYLVYKKNGKSLEVYFLSVLTIIFYLSYFILIFINLIVINLVMQNDQINGSSLLLLVRDEVTEELG